MTKKRLTLTLKQQKLVKGISENLSGKNNKTMQEIGLEAGYSASMAKKPEEFLKSEAVKKALAVHLASINRATQLHLAEMQNPDKIKDASVRDSAYVYDILVKNQRLLSGESTENKAISIQISEVIADKNDEKPA